MRNPHGSFIWYELMTSNITGSIAFYDKVAALKISPEGMGPQDYRMIEAPDGMVGGALPLTDAMREGGARPGWFVYVGVDDVDTAVAKVESAGGKTLMPAWDIPTIGRIAMVADPQGAPFYVMRGEPDQRSGVFDRGKVGHFGWNELHARDGGAALDFYVGQFGWKPTTEMDMGPMGKYRIFEVDGVDSGATFDSPAAAGGPFWLPYIGVADIDAAHAEIGPAGGSVMMGPSEVPGDIWIIPEPPA